MAIYSPRLHESLVTALDDEYRARAVYQSVLDRFGPVPVFVNILASEERHIAALTGLFQHYGLPLPPNRWAGQVTPPESVQAACELGVAAEIDNYRMYERLMAQVSEPEARLVFANLRNASLSHHLPVFQACVAATAAVPSGLPVATSARMSTPVPKAAAGSGSLALGLALGVAGGAGLLWWWSRRGRTA